MQARAPFAHVLVALVLLTLPAAAGKLHEVNAQSGPYTTIQSAVDAAQDGDVIHVAKGLYDEAVVIDGKQLILAGPDFAQVHSIGDTTPGAALTIRNLPAGKRVVVSGMRLRAYGHVDQHALLVEQCAGDVRVQGTSLRSENDAAVVRASASVVLDDVQAQSSAGDPFQAATFAGLRVEAGSTVHVTGGYLRGSTGGHVDASLGVPTPGGEALLVADSFVWLAGGTLVGGHGGYIEVPGCIIGSSNGAIVRTVDTPAPGVPLVAMHGAFVETPGQPGFHQFGCGPPPAQTPDHVGPAGSVVQTPGPERRVALVHLASDAMPIEVEGDTDATVIVVASFGAPPPASVAGYDGLLFVNPSAAVTLFTGMLPSGPGATTELVFPGPDLPAHFGRTALFVQALFVTPSGGLGLSNMATVVLL